MQPPPRRCAHTAMLGGFIVENENGYDRHAAGNSRCQRGLIGKAQVPAQPEDHGWGHLARQLCSQLEFTIWSFVIGIFMAKLFALCENDFMMPVEKRASLKVAL
jgi:hypothetical protein